jgi:hypothetical protein
MKVICAWCFEEGRPAVVREKEPFDDPEETHGVCQGHKAWLNETDVSVGPKPEASERE